jgi:HK97 family phage portal protein
MGLGRLLETRSTVITASDTVTGALSTFTIVDNLAPDWPTASYQGGMGIPGAWRASILLSDLLGQVPWDAWRVIGQEPESMITPRPPLLEQPNPPYTRMTTITSGMLDLIWHGNAIWVVASRNAFGWPTAVIPVPACNVAVRRVTPFASSPLPVGALEYKIGNLTLSSDDVIHVMGPCEPGAVRGLGVLETQLNALTLAQSQDRQASSISTAGVPTGILKSTDPDIEKNEALELKAAWIASQNTRTIAFLNATTEFTPLSWNPEELQLVEARKFSLNTLELIFGLPVGWLGGMNSARQYSNIEQDDINLLKFSLGGHLARFEQTLSLAFPRGTQVRADLATLMRSDTLTRYQGYAIGIAAQMLTPDEARAKEPGLKPLTAAQREQFAAAQAPAQPAVPGTPQPTDPTKSQDGKAGPGGRPPVHAVTPRITARPGR